MLVSSVSVYRQHDSANVDCFAFIANPTIFIERALSMRSLSSLLTILLVVGCGGGNSVELHPVTGTVTIDGQPATVGSISFMPDVTQNTKGPLATSQIGEDGTFTLMTGSKEGAIAGFHKVVVECPFDPGAGSSGSGSTTPEGGGAKCNIHVQYGAANTTPLSQEVKAGDNNFKIELKSKLD